MKKIVILLIVFLFSFQLFVLFGCSETATDVDTDNDTKIYPYKAIEFVVPLAPGGGGDRWARAISSVAPDYLNGQLLKVVNRPGASAAVGMKYVVDADPDGYVILAGSNTPILTSLVEDTGYTYSDLIIVATFRDEPVVLLAQPNAAFQNWDQFVTIAQTKPGELTLGGVMGVRVGIQTILGPSNIVVNHVPYDSTGAATTDFLGAHIDLNPVTVGTAISLVEGGKAIALVHTGESEIVGLPGVPSATDLGLEPFGHVSWIGVPLNTPLEIIEFLSEAFGRMLEDPSLLALAKAFGEDVFYLPYPEAHDYYLHLGDEMTEIMENMNF